MPQPINPPKRAYGTDREASAGNAGDAVSPEQRSVAAACFAWLIWAISVLLLFFSGPQPSSAGGADSQPAGAGAILLAGILCLTTVAAVVASRRPGNIIGWILSGVGLIMTMGGFADRYAGDALSAPPGALPGGEIAAWLANWALGPILYSVFIFLFLLFPDGRVLTPGWRPVAWITVAASAMLLLVDAFSPGHFTHDFTNIANPLGVGALRGLRDIVDLPLFLVEVSLLLLAVISLVLRFRQARGDERQQLKWFASSGALLGIIFAAGPVLWATPGGNVVWPFLFAIAVSAIPIAIGIAILKYRLYDIDVIIRRTLVYGVLTVLLAAVYWGVVVGLQAALRPIFGEGNDLAVVVSTLTIAALFMPLRRGTQNFIDRRFYRTKYDAARTLESFNVMARDEVDLRTLIGRLVEVVDDTMQPAQISLWLREPRKG